MPDYPYMDEGERLSKYRDSMMNIKHTALSGKSTKRHKAPPTTKEL